MSATHTVALPPITMVLGARLAPNMPTHRVGGEKTCCDQPISPTWQRFEVPLEAIGCPVCRTERRDA